MCWMSWVTELTEWVHDVCVSSVAGVSDILQNIELNGFPGYWPNHMNAFNKLLLNNDFTVDQ